MELHIPMCKLFHSDGGKMTTLVYVGANKGGSLRRIYQQFDQVIAFEPDPEMFADLENNIVETKDTEVVLVNAACSDQDGEQTFMLQVIV